MESHAKIVIRRRGAEKMARPGLNQHAGVGGAPGELLGVDLRRGLQPEGVSMFAPRQRATRRQIALQGGVQTLPALGGVIVVAPQMGLIMDLGKEVGHLVLNVGRRMAIDQPAQGARLVDQVRVGDHKPQPQPR